MVDNPYEKFIGKPGHYGVGPNIVTGVLREIDFRNGYLEARPSLVGVGKRVRLDYKNPTILNIPSGQIVSIRPLKNGDLARILRESNMEDDVKVVNGSKKKE